MVAGDRQFWVEEIAEVELVSKVELDCAVPDVPATSNGVDEVWVSPVFADFDADFEVSNCRRSRAEVAALRAASMADTPQMPQPAAELDA
jgi:hypothetical protein